MTNSENLTIKCRERVGRLTPHGIAASRSTGVDRELGEPDAFLTTSEGAAFLVKFWSGNTLQPELFDDKSAPVPLEETIEHCLIWRENERRKLESDSTPVWLILAPGLNDDPGHYPSEQSVSVLNKRQCAKPERMAEAILGSVPGVAFSSELLSQWRAVAVPEARIEQPPHVRRKIERAPAHRVAPLLLDYNQERCTRLDLEPDAGVKDTAEDLLVRVVTGVAGCGKTIVLLHRAALLAQHFPDSRVLIVSHNRPLIEDVDRRLRRQNGDRGNIQCKTFYQWLHRLAPPRGEAVKPHQIVGWVESRLQSGDYPNLEKQSTDWTREEMNWMFDHGKVDESYLTTERKGRGTGLRKSHRQEMLSLAREYRAYLREIGQFDWHESPLSVWENSHQLRPSAGFDHLLIDEAQFFSPIWLELLTQHLKPGGHLFLCADPTQGFLRRRMSWAQIGLSVRNRSHRLERPYRSTREILEFATRFYRNRLPDDDEPLNLPSSELLERMEAGIPPVILPGGSPEDQIQRLIGELKEFKSGGGEFGDILLLLAGRRINTRAVAERLNRELGEDAVADIKSNSFPDSAAGVCHLMAATGLERPIIFLLGIDELIEEERNPRLGEDEKLEKIRDHTRQIYVGLTRAMERLVIFSNNLDHM